MNSIVIYASRYGNTRKIAEAIGDALRLHGTTQLFAAEEAPTLLP
jgi:menaquinone-dependent protoporphyrinogen IX oxidase